MCRRIEFTPAYDKVDEGYGIHGVDMRWLLEGPRGVIQFVVFTNWHLPETQTRLDRKTVGGDLLSLQCLYHPMPADIGYHSPTPIHEWRNAPSFESCEYLGGRPCYYDGSSLYADVFFKLLIEKGHEAVWQKMEEYYQDTFGEPSGTVSVAEKEESDGEDV